MKGKSLIKDQKIEVLLGQFGLPMKSPFHDTYSNRVTIKYNMYRIDGQKQYYKNSDVPKKCVFCLQSSPQATFNKKAHIFPSYFGNRRFFSEEECDDCNHDLGQAENNLALMTEPVRSLFQIPRRPGEGRASWSDEPSPNITTHDMPMIRIITSEDSSVEIEVDSKTGTIEIEGPAPTYSPYQAMRAVFHSAWLLMDPEMRGRHPKVRELALGTCETLPLYFAE